MPAPMICIFGLSLHSGGAERQFVQLAKSLAAHGYGILFVTLYSGGSLHDELVDVPGIVVTSLGKRGWSDCVRPLWRFIQLLRLHRPVLVYSFLTSPNLHAAVVRLFRIIPRLTWGFRGYADAGMRTRIRGILARVLLKIFSRVPDRIVTNSEAGVMKLQQLGYPASRLRYVPNGIEWERFTFDGAVREQWRSEHGFGDQRVVGLLARLDPAKDIPTLLAAVSSVTTRNPNIRLVIAGSDPWNLIERYRGLALELGIAERMQFLPPERDPRRFLSGIDLFALSSISEGFPNVVAEALCAGLPVVTTRAGDAATIVGSDGVVVECRDVRGLAQAIERSLYLPREQARGERVRRYYSIAASVDATIAVFCELGVSPPQKIERELARNA